MMSLTFKQSSKALISGSRIAVGLGGGGGIFLASSFASLAFLFLSASAPVLATDGFLECCGRGALLACALGGMLSCEGDAIYLFVSDG